MHIAPTSYTYNHENIYSRDPEIIEFWGSGRPPGLQKPFQKAGRVAALSPSQLKGGAGRMEPRLFVRFDPSRAPEPCPIETHPYLDSY